MFYKLCKWLYEKLEPRFSPKIPSDLIEVFWGRDLGKLRFYGKRMTVAQVDYMLDWECENGKVYAEMGTQTRLYIKNRLIQLKLMDEGVIPEELRRGNGISAGDEVWRDAKTAGNAGTKVLQELSSEE